MRNAVGPLFVWLLLLAELSAGHAAAQSFEGVWVGALRQSGTELRVVLHLECAADGSLRGTLDSPDQFAFGIPIDQVTMAGQSLHFEVAQVALVFDGSLRADASARTRAGLEWSARPASRPGAGPARDRRCAGSRP